MALASFEVVRVGRSREVSGEIRPQARVGGATRASAAVVRGLSGLASLRPMRIRAIQGSVLVALTLACAAEQADPYVPVADVQQLMAMVLEPASEVYWDAVGTIIDSTGTTEIEPRSDEEWEAVRNAAYVIAESGNLLMVQSRPGNEPGWIPMSQALVDVGRRAIEAAESRDKAAVFDMGAEVYYVCTGCHATYAVETLRPNVELGN